MGPLPQAAREAVTRWLALRAEDDPNAFPHVMDTIEALRDRLGALVGADGARMEYAPNTSYALNVLAQGLDWQPGDRILVPEGEFPANVFPWLGLERRGVAVDRVPAPDGTFSVEAVAERITSRTRLVAVSWVQFLSGFRCDLAALSALCRERGVLLALDAIQGLGALRLDLRETPVDFLACGSHKWLMGLTGIGFFYVSEALQARLTPTLGWLNGPVDWDDLGAASPSLFNDARRFRLGTLNLAGIVALDAALGVYEAVGKEEAERRVLAGAARLADGLDRLGLRRFGSRDPRHASGIVTVEVAGNGTAAESVRLALAERGVTASVREGKLRLAPSWPTPPEHIDAALDRLGAILQA